MKRTEKVDVCIVGAGIAGCTAAHVFAKLGYQVLLLERDLHAKDSIVGELLQPKGVELLKRLVPIVDFEAFSPVPIRGYSMFYNEEHFEIDYADQEGKSVNGLGLRYHNLIDALRNSFSQVPNISVREARVEGFSFNSHNSAIESVRFVCRKTRKVEEVSPALTILSTGHAASLLKSLGIPKPEKAGQMNGMLFDRKALPFPDRGHVFIGKRTPVLAYPVSDEKARLLVDVPNAESIPHGIQRKEFLEKEISALFPQKMKEAIISACQEDKSQVKPNYHTGASTLKLNNLLILGDSLNTRHPLTGGGMTVALQDIDLIRSLTIEGGMQDSAAIKKLVGRFHSLRKHRIATINILALALYKVFNHPLLGRDCFDYLKRGESYSGEPMQLLSGISSSLSTLINHFYAVAIFGLKERLFTSLNPQNVKNAYRALKDATSIIVPLLREEVLSGVTFNMLKKVNEQRGNPETTNTTHTGKTAQNLQKAELSTTNS